MLPPFTLLTFPELEKKLLDVFRAARTKEAHRVERSLDVRGWFALKRRNTCCCFFFPLRIKVRSISRSAFDGQMLTLAAVKVFHT